MPMEQTANTESSIREMTILFMDKRDDSAV